MTPGPWENFYLYAPLPGFSEAWRARLRHLGAAVAALPGAEVRPDGRPPHRVRYGRCRDDWPAGLPAVPWAGGVLCFEAAPARTPTRGAPTFSVGGLDALVKLPPGTAVFADILDRDSDDVLASGAFVVDGLRDLMRLSRSSSGPREFDPRAIWREFTDGPEALDAVLATFCATGDPELAKVVIDASRAR